MNPKHIFLAVFLLIPSLDASADEIPRYLKGSPDLLCASAFEEEGISDLNKAFGGFYAELDEGRSAWTCRDLYDWHDENEHGYPNSIEFDLTVAQHLARPAAKMLLPLMCKVYTQVGVLDLCDGYDPIEVRDYAGLSIILPDAFWPRLGGKSFVSNFEIDASQGWAHTIAMTA